MSSMVEGRPPALGEVEALAERYADLPIEVIFKEDLLRRGMAWSLPALELAAAYKPKAYFIFSFDQQPLDAMPAMEGGAAPEEIALSGGSFNFQRVVVSPCSVTAISYGPQGPVVLTVNDTAATGALVPS